MREALTHALAGLACLLFVLGLTDTPRLEIQAIAAPQAPVDATARDAVLEVSVTNASDQPLEGANVELFWEREGVEYFVGSGASDRGGGVRLTGLPRGVSWVLVSASGWARKSARLTLGAGVTRFSAKLEREAHLSARVTDERGEPIARATLLVTADDPLPFGALTGPDGRARVGRLPKAPWTVRASAPGYESVERDGVENEVTLALRRLATLRVRVEKRDKSPAPGAIVSIAGSTLWPARRTPADAEGRAKISGLLAGAYDLEARLGSDVSQPIVGLELERGAELDVTLTLDPGRFVTVIVTDGDGKAPALVPNADVVLTPSGVGSFPLLGRTGNDGRVTLGPIAAGPATLAARAEGFVSSALVPVPESTSEPVTVALLRGATLRGDVVDGRGFPIEGASIEIVGTDAFGLPVSETPLLAAFRRTHFDWALAGPSPLIPAGELGVMPGPVPPIPKAGVRVEPGADLWALADAPPPLIEAWVSRSDGSFVARPVTPGRVRAVARHPDYVEGASELVTVAPGGEARVKVVLLAGGTLSGRVLDDRSLPVEGADVEVASSRTSSVNTVLSGRDGSFELTGVPATAVISVRRAGGDRRVALRKEVEVPEGKRTEIELVLPAPRDPVRFVVTDPDEDPIELAEVTVLSLDPEVPLRETSFTDSEGGTEVSDARGLALRVVVEAPGFPRKALLLERAPEATHVVLEQGVIVEGSVTAVRGRRFVEGARVTLLSEGARRVAQTDAEGRYRIREVAAGPAKLSVSHPDYATAVRDLAVAPTGRADRALELDPIDLSEPGSVEGEVVDADGNPVGGARVSIGRAEAYLPAGTLPPGVAQTDENGHFELSGVPEGRHLIEAFSTISGRGRVKDIEVSANRVTDGIKIVLSPAPSEDTLAGGNIAITLGERGRGASLEIVVTQVAASSEAERAGLASGDILVGIDGTRPSSMSDARSHLAGRAGTDVVIELLRGEERVVLRVAREVVRR
ncbi:MAG TPA: carboxypeptidase regulatory-like domain-containing protein [Polyangiaceae bacterium]